MTGGLAQVKRIHSGSISHVIPLSEYRLRVDRYLCKGLSNASPERNRAGHTHRALLIISQNGDHAIRIISYASSYVGSSVSPTIDTTSLGSIEILTI